MYGLSRFSLFACVVCTLAAAPPDADVSRAKQAIARLPLRFEENHGQFNPSVRYAARSNGFTLFLAPEGASLALGGAKRVDIRLLHANPSPRIEAIDQLAGRTNYFVGARENWRPDVPSFERVRYRAVYPGVDLVYYGNQNQLEYDFVLQPGADPHAIRMNFRGSGRVTITPEGDLLLESKGGRLLQKRPVIYQEDPGTSARHQIAGRYTLLARNVVGIRLDGYNRSQRLVIDPVLEYGTYMGGAGADQINAVKWTSNGQLWIVGTTATSDLVPIGNAYAAISFGQNDAFVAAIDTNPTGAFGFVYLTYLGGGLNDSGLALDVDAAGFVYVTGATASANFPVVGNAVQTSGSASTTDAYVSILDPHTAGAGGLVYSTYLGGADGNDQGNGIAVGPHGKIYVIGTTFSDDFPLSDNPYASSRYGPSDAFLAEIDPTNPTLLYSTYLGGENGDDGRGIAVDRNGLVYFGINTFSTQFPLAGSAYSPVNLGEYDIAIGVMDMTQAGTASLVYSTYFGGSDTDIVHKVALDNNGHLMLTGYTLSANYPVTAGTALQGLYGGNGDAFVTIVNPFAAPGNFVVYSTYLGGSQGDVAYDIAQDSTGLIVVTGYTLSPDYPTTSNAPQPQWGGGVNMFIARFAAGVAGLGALQMSTYEGGSSQVVGTCLSLKPDGTIYTGGYTTGGLPIAPNTTPTQSTYAGGPTDGFILVVGNNPPPAAGVVTSGFFFQPDHRPPGPRGTHREVQHR